MDDTKPAPVLLEKRGPVAVLTLNRPECANALNAPLLNDLHHATALIADDPAVRVVILTGAGRHFCGGADLREKAAKRYAVLERHPHVLDLSRLPQPVIAAINGAALGGGCEVALSCDFRFMSEDATIGLPAIRFGALPGAGAAVRLPSVVGLPWAKRLVMTGDPVDAAQEERIGLVDQVVAPDELLPAAEEFALRLAERADYALRTAKVLLDRPLQADLAAVMPLAYELAQSMATPEQRAAARAAAAKQLPTYAKIFGKHENRTGGRAAEPDLPPPPAPADSPAPGQEPV